MYYKIVQLSTVSGIQCDVDMDAMREQVGGDVYVTDHSETGVVFYHDIKAIGHERVKVADYDRGQIEVHEMHSLIEEDGTRYVSEEHYERYFG